MRPPFQGAEGSSTLTPPLKFSKLNSKERNKENMAKLLPGKNGKGLIKIWEKGESGNPKGRPRKPVLLMKSEGYKLHEINDTIQMMIGMDVSQLSKIWENPKATILERTIASALKKGIEKGNLDAMETLFNRVYGKPSEKFDITTEGGSIAPQPFVINIIKPNEPKKEILNEGEVGTEP